MDAGGDRQWNYERPEALAMAFRLVYAKQGQDAYGDELDAVVAEILHLETDRAAWERAFGVVHSLARIASAAIDNWETWAPPLMTKSDFLQMISGALEDERFDDA